MGDGEQGFGGAVVGRVRGAGSYVWYYALWISGCLDTSFGVPDPSAAPVAVDLGGLGAGG